MIQRRIFHDPALGWEPRLPFPAFLTKAPSYCDDPQLPHYLCTISVPGSEAFLSAGIALDDRAARRNALAEAAERFWLRQCSTLGTPKPYRVLPEDSADPALWLDVRSSRGSRRRRSAREVSFRWVLGSDLVRNRPRWIPAQQVYVPYPFHDEFQLRRPISTGTAFGYSMQSATLRALLECIERDAFMIAYLRRWSMRRVHHRALAQLQRAFEAHEKKLVVFVVPNDFGVVVMMGLIIDRGGHGPAVSVGLKAGFDPVRAAIGAALEAHHARFCHRRRLEGTDRPRITRAHQVVDEVTRAAYWYPPGAERRLDFLLRSSGRVKLQHRTLKGGLGLLLNRLRRKRYHVYRVVLARDPALGVIVKVLVPELQPLQRVEDRGQFMSRHLQEQGAARLNLIPNPFE